MVSHLFKEPAGLALILLVLALGCGRAPAEREVSPGAPARPAGTAASPGPISPEWVTVYNPDWEGRQTWEFRTPKALPHHDVLRLANGNTLVLVLPDGEPADTLSKSTATGSAPRAGRTGRPGSRCACVPSARARRSSSCATSWGSKNLHGASATRPA